MGTDHIIITIMGGDDEGKVFDLDKTPIMLGRHPEDDVCLPSDMAVSRHHAQITKEGDSYFIEDVGPEGQGSTNGTFVNGEKIAGKTPISSGDMPSLATVSIKFESKPVDPT